MFWCEACEKVLAHDGAVKGHLRSKAHLEQGGSEESIVPHTPVEEVSEPMPNPTSAKPISPPLVIVDPEAEALRAEVERLTREVSDLRATAAANDPYVDFPVLDTEEAVRAYFTAEELRTMAKERLARKNRADVRKGNPPLYSRLDGEVYEALLQEAEDELVTERVVKFRQWVSEIPEDRTRLRTVKMVRPVKMRDGKLSWELRHGATLVEIPLEGQINNGIGSIADGILKYQNKRIRIARPYRCQLRDCNQPAAVGASNQLTQSGYCSEDHRTTIEGAGSRTPGEATVRDRTLTFAR